jgi:hypothetical protein
MRSTLMDTFPFETTISGSCGATCGAAKMLPLKSTLEIMNPNRVFIGLPLVLSFILSHINREVFHENRGKKWVPSIYAERIEDFSSGHEIANGSRTTQKIAEAVVLKS